MEIRLMELPIKDLVNGYENSEENGVYGYGGKLNIRPKYQREFVYDDKERNAVIETIFKGFPSVQFPLNVMYWAENEDGTFEMIDGQQRTLSICHFYDNDFSIKINGSDLGYRNLRSDLMEWFDNYKLMIYICKGTDSEKLEWFRIINIAGEKLTEQELRNAIYTGTWVSDAKHFFSKRNCLAEKIAGDYLKGSSIRQEYLETVLRWVSAREDKTINSYMREHQFDDNADELKEYFKDVFAWVESVFPNTSEARKRLMNGLDWGLYYNMYKDDNLQEKAEVFEATIIDYLNSDEITKKNGGIYKYLLTGEAKHLSVREFSPSDKQWGYSRCGGHCAHCLELGDDTVYEIDEMQADHIVPWSRGGKTERDNLQMLCIHHNNLKSDS